MDSQANAEKPSRSRLYATIAVVGMLLVLLAYVLGSYSLSGRRAAVHGWVPASAYDEADWARSAGVAKLTGGGRAGGGGRPPAAERSALAEAPAFQAGPQVPWPTSPMLIRTATLRLRVEDVTAAHEKVTKIAREARGYVANTSFNSESGPAYATITIRVPSQGLDSIVDRIAALGKLLNKEISAQEVTEEYVDLSSRKRNFEREEGRLLDLLERAGKVTDLLEVERTLSRVRGQIETIAGRMRYLENRVALSTLHVYLQGPQPGPTAGGPAWAASDVFREATRSLIDTGRGLATIGIWVGIYTPVWLPLLLLLLWLIRRTSGIRTGAEAASGK